MDVTGGFLNQTVTITPYSSMTSEGDRSYGAAVSYPARIENVTKLIRNQSGEQVVSTAQVFMQPSAVVTYYDRITLPDGTTPVILRINYQPDLDGSIAYCEVDT